MSITTEQKAMEFEIMAQEQFGQQVKVKDFKIQGARGYGYRLYEKDETGEYKIVFTVRQGEFAQRLDEEWHKRFDLYVKIATEMMGERNITFDLNPISGTPELRLFLNIPYCGRYGANRTEPELHFVNERELRAGLARLLVGVTQDEEGDWFFDIELLGDAPITTEATSTNQGLMTRENFVEMCGRQENLTFKRMRRQVEAECGFVIVAYQGNFERELGYTWAHGAEHEANEYRKRGKLSVKNWHQISGLAYRVGDAVHANSVADFYRAYANNAASLESLERRFAEKGYLRLESDEKAMTRPQMFVSYVGPFYGDTEWWFGK